jgi:protein TonB
MVTKIQIFQRPEGLEEMIFENRNKDYGAYALRKQLNATLTKSVLLTLCIAAIVCLLLLYLSNREEINQPLLPEVITATLIKLPNLDFKIPQPPPESDFLKKAVNIYLPPKPVEELQQNNSEKLISMPDLTHNLDIPRENILQSAITDPEIPVEDKPFFKVEEMPAFNKGGLENFIQWVQANLIYPQIAIENEIEGKVTASFVIGVDGHLDNINIIRGVDESLDNEAIRVLKMSPLWTPGKQGGKPVRVMFIMPIVFQLNH